MKHLPDIHEQDRLNRRTFLKGSAAGIGMAALGSLLGPSLFASPSESVTGGPAAAAPPVLPSLGLPNLPHFPAKARRIIYLFQSGAPSQLDLWDYKPQLAARRGEDLPASIRMGQRLTGMTSGQKSFPVAPSIFSFSRAGKNGTWISELLPHTAKVVDEMCVIKSLYTEAINHDPAVTFFQSGSQIAGRPAIGSWLSYGLGSENRDLPAYVVMISRGTGQSQPLCDRNWGSGFLATQHSGVRFRSGAEPVYYLSDPEGVDRATRRTMLDGVAALNHLHEDVVHDPDIAARITQYELAYRMQASVPELADISQEPKEVLDMYGPDVHKPGTYAANCLLARRLAERDVRFVQLFHQGWDQHGDLPGQIRTQCRDTDQPTAALLMDLKQRGLLDDTLVIWGGEFGRTVYSQGELTAVKYGRDHHPRCFTVWLAGAGIKGGVSIGETDDYCYNIAADPVHVHDLHATILYLMGIDHTRLTYKFQGRHYRLTDVAGNVVKAALA